MRTFISMAEIVAFLGCLLFGYLWYTHPLQNYEPLFCVTSLFFVLAELARRYLPRHGLDPNRLSEFIREGQTLRARSSENPLPIEDHNTWVDHNSSYLIGENKAPYETRLRDFSGMVFYVDGSEKSKYERSIDGRIRRLHEFLAEIQKN